MRKLNTKEEKNRLRSFLRATEKTLPPEYKAKADASIVKRLKALPAYRQSKTVFCFSGTIHEINTRPFLEDVLYQKKRLSLPRCIGPGQMELCLVTSLSQLHEGAYHILEPKTGCIVIKKNEVDFAVIPCLSCNENGDRLGQGGGFYDRFIHDYSGEKVMICRKEQMLKKIPMEPHDKVIRQVIHEKTEINNDIIDKKDNIFKKRQMPD